MGLLNTYFAAADDDAALAASELTEPEGLVGKGFTGIELDSLLEILVGGPVDERFGAAPDPLGDPDAESWTFPVRPELTAALADLSVEDRPGVAERWAATEELEMGGWQAADAASLLDRLAAVAADARAEGHQLYFWLSL